MCVYLNKYQFVKESLSDTLESIKARDPNKVPRGAPVGRPRTRTQQSAQSNAPSDVKEAPKVVQDAYDKLKMKWRRGVKIERTYCTPWYTIHVIDAGATDNIQVPCPKCGFDVVTKPTGGWIKTPRVAHGIASTEYFVGRSYACLRCKDIKRRDQVRLHLTWDGDGRSG